jgi:hypothetical protein
MDAGATQVGIFSKQVWVLSGERHHLDKETPEYTYFQIDLAANECVRGWIMFKTRTDQPIVTVRYQTGNGYLLKWEVPADQG